MGRAEADRAQDADLGPSLPHVAEHEEPNPDRGANADQRRQHGGKCLALPAQFTAAGDCPGEGILGGLPGPVPGLGPGQGRRAALDDLRAGQNPGDLRPNLRDAIPRAMAFQCLNGMDQVLHAK